MTQSAIAEEMGISQMHVSRLLARSMTVLGEAAGTGGRAAGRAFGALPAVRVPATARRPRSEAGSGVGRAADAGRTVQHA